MFSGICTNMEMEEVEEEGRRGRDGGGERKRKK